ncbi:hypothetical protein BEWA_043620 [Theileria equi strain WA]|uniref:Uncharacterized protein n=1 Tax=Theileria equi strain WA TaxID=1537102 RepID=L1LG48_THEEQ|nr:hypothetical protein BEWA_043620 [Theileria equi strain WA]EKX74321.1 hypothetical protein BEWA_043620 [Theileria equi strain WA]|eukprot:XP_004833773.1 hypothetical protein BEWA_043620 [Theileria equi strain WA]
MRAQKTPSISSASDPREGYRFNSNSSNENDNTSILIRRSSVSSEIPRHEEPDTKLRPTGVSYERISPENRRWLLIWRIFMTVGIVLLVIAYAFFVMGLFYPLIYINAGEISDPDEFEPTSETLPHSIVTLYRQGAYTTIFIAITFSLMLPFIKMFALCIIPIIVVKHRSKQLLIYFGSNSSNLDRSSFEDDKAIKYSREILLILKLISKFQLVDSIILFFNIAYLRSAFVWAEGGHGLLYIIIYCLASLAGTQLVNLAVEGEKDIFDYWYAIRYAINPNSKRSISLTKGAGGNDNQDDPRKNWYTSEVFICLLVIFNILSGVSMLANEKLFSVSFTADRTKLISIDGNSFTILEIIMNLSDCWGVAPIFILFIQSIVIPLVFSVLFVSGIFCYNFTMHAKTNNRLMVRVNDDKDSEECLNWEGKCTKFIFGTCNVLSEWSSGEVIALGALAAYYSLLTAYRVKLSVPPKNFASCFSMVGVFGISSLLLNIVFYIWNNRVKHELSDVSIFVSRLETPKEVTPEYLNQNSNVTTEEPSDDVPKYKLIFIRIIDGIRYIIYSKVIVSLFFASLFLVMIFLTVFAFTFTIKEKTVNQHEVQRFLDTGMPQIYTMIKKNLPMSFGQCDYPPAIAPIPCSGTSPLFRFHGTAFVEIPWISGVQSINFLDSEFNITPEKRLQFRMHITFNKLRLFSKAGICIGPCKTLINGDNLCCGDNIHVEIVASIECNEKAPQLRNLNINALKVKNIRVMSNLNYIIHKIVNIESVIESRLKTHFNQIMTDSDFKILWRGVPFTLLEFINYVLLQNFPRGLKCPN